MWYICKIYHNTRGWKRDRENCQFGLVDRRAGRVQSDMAEINRFTLKGKKLASVTCSEDEFNQVLQLVKNNIIRDENKNLVNDKDIAEITRSRHIPMLGAGTETAFLFSRFQCENRDYMSIIQDGYGQSVLQEMYDKYMN